MKTRILVQKVPTFGNIAFGILEVLKGMYFDAYERPIVPAPEESICNNGASADGGYLVDGIDVMRMLSEEGGEGFDLVVALTMYYGYHWSHMTFVFHCDDVVTLPLQ